MTTLFISDLHLDPSRPAVTRAFLDLLSGEAISADALYILGDFFEVWIGDDDDTELNQTVIEALKALTTKGTPVYIMHGNRDFLIGEQFCQQSGCQLIADPTVINLYGRNVLLLHGDSLCTDDTDYMAFRQQCRSQAWQNAFLSQGIEQRRQLAKQMRAESKTANSNKADDIMDVNQHEVLRMFTQHDVDLMIHGHTHRPAIHQHKDSHAKRVVLGDWHNSGWIVRFSTSGDFTLDKFSIS